jgi:hypothetical protein
LSPVRIDAVRSLSRTMKARLVFCLVSFLSGSTLSPVLGEEPLRLSWTLEAVLRRATERHPQLEARRAGERAVEARSEQAGLRPNPTVEVALENVLGTGDLQGVRGLETTVQAQQTVERGGKREKRLAVAGQDRETAVRETAVIQTEVLTATAIAYVEVLAAQQRLALAESPVALARETLASVSARVQAGAGATAEVARARVALALAEAELARNQTQLHSARTALAATWGGQPQDVGTLPGAGAHDGCASSGGNAPCGARPPRPAGVAAFPCGTGRRLDLDPWNRRRPCLMSPWQAESDFSARATTLPLLPASPSR